MQKNIQNERCIFQSFTFDQIIKTDCANAFYYCTNTGIASSKTKNRKCTEIFFEYDIVPLCAEIHNKAHLPIIICSLGFQHQMFAPPSPNDIEMLAAELSSTFNSLGTADVQDSVENEGMFEALYENFPISVGKAASRQERKDNNYTCTTLVYGEITYRPFAEVIKFFSYILLLPINCALANS